MNPIIESQKMHDHNHQEMKSRTCFNELVLKSMKENRPDGTFNELLIKIKQLSPDKPLTLKEINSTLLYSDGILRNDSEYKDYANEVLDKRVMQAFCLNALYNNMLYELSTDSDDDELFI